MTLLEPGTIELFRKVRNVGHLPKSQEKTMEKTWENQIIYIIHTPATSAILGKLLQFLPGRVQPKNGARDVDGGWVGHLALVGYVSGKSWYHGWQRPSLNGWKHDLPSGKLTFTIFSG